MKRFLFILILCTLFSCQQKSKESKKSTDQKISNKETIVATKLERLDSITLDSKIAKKLSNKEISSIFSKKIKKNLEIKYPINQGYSYKDSSGVHYLLLTDHYKQASNNDKTYYAIKAFNIFIKNNELKKRTTFKDVIDNEWETSILFWNKYSEITDIDSDGIVDLILVYGTTGQEMYADGRVKIMIYHNHKRITIRHQNSEYGGRLTKISSKFYFLPKQIQEAVIEKMRLMTQNGHAVFTKGWEKKMKEKATRIE